jgi:uncharacterized protein (TIGR03435 family)
MKDSRKTIERILQTEPTRVSDGELDGIGERMLHKLHHSNPGDIIDDREPSVVSRPRIGLRFAVAATLILTVAIGVYAYRAQRASTPKVAVPAAPSVKAAAEPPQVAVLTPASTKPEAAPSREEPLARAAAQIAAAQATDVGAARPKFGAASVRPLPAGPPDFNNGFQCLGIDGTGSATARRGRCTGQTDLAGLVLDAYRTDRPIVFVTGGTRITGIPDSLRGRFQIEAVADDPEHVTERELKLMLQTLLEDRFKARVHLEMREDDGYVLTIAKSGIKFKETSVDEKASATTLTPVEALNQARLQCQYNGRLARPAEIFVRGKCGIKELITYVRQMQPLNIADKTGLMGIYNIDFVLEPIYLVAPTATGGGARGGGGQSARREFTTPIPKALEEQLGLHLELTKIPVEFVVVDHIEQPTEN